MQTKSLRAPAVLRGLWLNPGVVNPSIEPLLLDMLALTHSDLILRQAVLEEMQRRTKFRDVILRALSLQERSVEEVEGYPLVTVSTSQDVYHPWRDALLAHGGDCPIGFVVNTYDYGKLVLLHEVFHELTPEQQELIRQYARLALRGKKHHKILSTLKQQAPKADYTQHLFRDARRRVQILDPSVLFSPDGGLRVELGSLSQTTKNLLREGITGEYLFILPKHLFESKTNYADVEFLVYLNFFVRYGTRTRIVGTARQREILEHLLRLTIFGLFDPHMETQPTFEMLHERYLVSDRETYALFRMLYEKYGVRQNCCATGVILDLDAYIDFVVMEGGVRPLLITSDTAPSTANSTPAGQQPYSVQIIPLPHGSFEVTIAQVDGRKTVKTLEVHRPTVVRRSIPEESCRAIRFATDRPRFGLTPLGTSHGFDPTGDLTCFVIWINGLGILVDPSPEALDYLDYIGVASSDLPYVFLTHIHSDHDGGLIGKLLSGSRTTIIASDVVFRLFIEKAQLVTGQDFEQAHLVEHIPANPGHPVDLEIAGEHVTMHTRWNLHTIPTNGFTLTMDGKTFGYAGDTQYEPAMLRHMLEHQQLTPAQYRDLMYFFWTEEGASKVDVLYHEAGIPPIHTDKTTLTSLSDGMRSRTFLVHIADRDVPVDFLPPKPPLFATHVLFPPTPLSRNRTLRHALGLVSYLYDSPFEIMDELLRRCTLHMFEPDEVIIQAGQVHYTEPLTFYVIADGQVEVSDNGRVLSRLYKGDSFGEWAISHQRGFRLTDVIARRPTQVMEFNEDTYRWLTEKHQVVQPRIGKIRELWPKLQAVRARARQKSAQDVSRTRSVIEDMNSSQLAAFAVFGEVRRYQRWEAVVTEGEAADGLYVLLSGHLQVSAKGKAIGELTEADVFGELGLLEARERMATVRVASADADIMFMSRQNFNTLLQQAPAFSFGVWNVAAQRQEKARESRPRLSRASTTHDEDVC